ALDLDVERGGFAQGNAVAVEPCTHLLRMCRRREQRQQCEQDKENSEKGAAHHSPPCRRRCCSSRKRSRNRPPGSSGTRRNQAWLASRFSRCAGVSDPGRCWPSA